MAHVIADRVLESSVSAGAGPFTLAGAVLGFRAFTSVCAVTDTVPYYIEAVDDVGRPTGEYEFGLGTYSAANQLTRTTVRGSSNGGLAVSFSAGTKLVGLGVPAPNSAATRSEWRNSLGLSTVGNAVAVAVDAAAARTAIGAAPTTAATTAAAGLVELATDGEAQAGTDATRSVTPDNLGATVLGIGQAWAAQARVINTNYPNNTGRSIEVMASLSSGTNDNAEIQIDSVTIGRVGVVAGLIGNATFVVPPGKNYRIVASFAVVNAWSELR